MLLDNFRSVISNVQLCKNVGWKAVFKWRSWLWVLEVGHAPQSSSAYCCFLYRYYNIGYPTCSICQPLSK